MTDDPHETQAEAAVRKSVRQELRPLADTMRALGLDVRTSARKVAEQTPTFLTEEDRAALADRVNAETVRHVLTAAEAVSEVLAAHQRRTYRIFAIAFAALLATVMTLAALLVAR
ncbi:hypothetical protein [Streptodolium elevatio]|uniref:Uncharacterized protein n=1 Tax=Streptodolium elevatio TaxID=3157996 RepID=A0ABV3DNK6_9ACTN